MPDEIAERFGLFRLEGPQFEAPGVPVDALLEAVTYRALVLEVARGLFLEQNPDRARSRRNMDREFDLRLTAVDNKCADLVLVRNTVAVDQLGVAMPVSAVFAESRDLVTETLRAVGQGRDIPTNFPARAKPQLRQLGRTLKPGNWLEVGDNTGRKSAKFGVGDRAKLLVLVSPDSSTIEQRVAGRIVELDPELGAFHLRTSDGERIQSSFDTSVVSVPATLLANSDGDGPLVAVEGKALVDEEGSLQRFLSVSAVEVLRSDRAAAVLSRLEQLRALDDGWMGAGSVKPKSHLMEQARRVLERLESVPEAFDPTPLPDGGLRFEWSRGAVNYVAEIESDGGFFMCVLAEDAVDDTESQLPEFDDEQFRTFIETGRF